MTKRVSRYPNLKARIAGMLLLACMLPASLTARAEVSERDLQVLARALSFLEVPFSGEVRLGIVHDPANTRSLYQAEKISDMLNRQASFSGNLKLLPVLVPLSRVHSVSVDLIFLTEFMGPSEPALKVLTIPCVTVELSQVRQASCVMAVRSIPKIEIVVNRQAAERTGTEFASVFRMLIREI